MELSCHQFIIKKITSDLKNHNCQTHTNCWSKNTYIPSIILTKSTNTLNVLSLALAKYTIRLVREQYNSPYIIKEH